MKKLVAITLVLAMASLANAGLSFEIDGTIYADGSTVDILPGTTIGLYNDTQFTGAPDIAWIEIDPAAKVDSSEWIQAPDAVLPGTWTITDYGLSSGLYYYWIQNTIAGVGDSMVGTFASIDVDESTTFTVYMSDFATVVSTIGLNVVPEPATMGLLGLGSLFLARRKK